MYVCKFTGTDFITETDQFFVGFCHIYIKYPLILYFNVLCMPSCMKQSRNDITTLASYAQHGSEWILSSQCNTG